MPAAAQRESNSLLWVGGIALLGVFLWRKLNNAGIVQDPIEALKMKGNVERLRIGKLSRVKISKDNIEFDFPVENPNNDPLIIKAIVGDIYIADKNGKALRIGTVNHFGTDVIKPTGATNFQLFAKIKLVNEFLYLTKVFNGTWQGAVLTFNGTVNANGMPWPVRESVRLA